MTHANKMKVIALLESAWSEQDRDCQFELAYQAKCAVERIRFAVRQIEDAGITNERLREAAFQLTDATDRLQSADRRFQNWLEKLRAREV